MRIDIVNSSYTITSTDKQVLKFNLLDYEYISYDGDDNRDLIDEPIDFSELFEVIISNLKGDVGN